MMWQDQMVEVMMWWIQMLMSDAWCLNDVMRTKTRQEWLRDNPKGCRIKWRLQDQLEAAGLILGSVPGQSCSDFVTLCF